MFLKKLLILSVLVLFTGKPQNAAYAADSAPHPVTPVAPEKRASGQVGPEPGPLDCPETVLFDGHVLCQHVGFLRETGEYNLVQIGTLGPYTEIIIDLTLSTEEWCRFAGPVDRFVRCQDIFYDPAGVSILPDIRQVTAKPFLWKRGAANGWRVGRLEFGEQVLVAGEFGTDMRGVTFDGGWCWLDVDHTTYAACKYLET